MKRDIVIFVSNIVILFFAVGIVINFVSLYNGKAASVAGDIVSLSGGL